MEVGPLLERTVIVPIRVNDQMRRFQSWQIQWFTRDLSLKAWFLEMVWQKQAFDARDSPWCHPVSPPGLDLSLT